MACFSVAMVPDDGWVRLLSLSVSSVPRPVTPVLPANNVLTSSGWSANALVSVSSFTVMLPSRLNCSPRSNRLVMAPPVLILTQQLTQLARQALQRAGIGEWTERACLTVVGRLGIGFLDGVLKSFDKALDGVRDTARI